MRKDGVVPGMHQAVRMSGSPLGVHGAGKDNETILCGLAITNPDVKASVQAAKVAQRVSCRFRQVCLVGAGVLDAKAETVSPYAADYGTRDLESELKALAKDEAASA